MRTPPTWAFHVLAWSLAAIGLIAIASMIPWPVIEQEPGRPQKAVPALCACCTSEQAKLLNFS
jgi:hypothetical protein